MNVNDLYPERGHYGFLFTERHQGFINTSFSCLLIFVIYGLLQQHILEVVSSPKVFFVLGNTISLNMPLVGGFGSKVMTLSFLCIWTFVPPRVSVFHKPHLLWIGFLKWITLPSGLYFLSRTRKTMFSNCITITCLLEPNTVLEFLLS